MTALGFQDAMAATDQTGSNSDAGVISVGGQLRRARDAKNLSREDVAKTLNIQLCQIVALEEDRPDSLPPLAFAAGFVRSYARLLGLDGDAMVSDYKAQMKDLLKGAATGQDFVTARDLAHDHGSPARLALMALVFLGIAALIAGAVGAGWTLIGDASTHRTAATLAFDPVNDKGVLPVARTAAKPRSPADSVTPPRSVSLAPVAAGNEALPATSAAVETDNRAIEQDFGFTITALDVSWVRIRDADGIEIANQILRTGQQIHIEKKDRVTLTTGNLEGLAITLNGTPLPAASKIMADAAGDSMRSLVLDRTALLQDSAAQNF